MRNPENPPLLLSGDDVRVLCVQFYRVGDIELRPVRKPSESEFVIKGVVSGRTVSARAVYLFTTRQNELDPWEGQRVGQSAELETRLASYQIDKVNDWASKPRNVSIQGKIRTALEHGAASVWIADCSSGEPCQKSLEAALLETIKWTWNDEGGHLDSDYDRCMFCLLLRLRPYFHDRYLSAMKKWPYGAALLKHRIKPVDHQLDCNCLKCTLVSLATLLQAEERGSGTKMNHLANLYLSTNGMSELVIALKRPLN